MTTLDRFIDLVVLKEQAEKLDSATLREEQRIGLEQFWRAWRRKQAGKPDLTGYERRGEQDE